MTQFLSADPSRRTSIRFAGPTGELAGDLYRPPNAADDEPTPGIALCGPISSVKEQTVPHYAERLADAGYTALTFDPTSFGDSDGTPRARYDPYRVIDDYGAAVHHLFSRADIDPSRVGIVGICMGGGYAVSLGARNKRLKAVVSIAGGYNIGETFQKALGVDGLSAYLAQINDLVQEQYRSGDVAYVPTVARSLSDDVPVAAMPNEEAYDYYVRTSREDAPHWPQEITADSLPTYFSYNAVAAAALVAPTPLLVIHGTTDAALLPEYAQATFDAAHGTKDLVWITTSNHVELYDQDPYVSEAAGRAIEWLDRHVKGQSA